MWRFLNNIPRALKNYHGPRASIGVYVESDDKDQEPAVKHENASQQCVVQKKTENCFCPFKNANIKGTTILWRLVCGRDSSRTSGATDDQHSKRRTNDEEHQEFWWNFCQKEFTTFLQGPNRIFEVLAAGSSFLWSPHHKKRGQKHELVYRVLFSIYADNAPVIKTICDKQDETIPKLPKVIGQTLLAIKDASGSEQDRIINEAKSESLDAALKEFQQMCTDYSSINESLLGIMAADDGDMSDAVQHLHTACSMGNKTSCFNIGLFYEMGTGVSKNLEKAKHYYKLAASKGHNQAMYNLGQLCLQEGDGEKGLEWIQEAARAGLLQAQKYLGVHYMVDMEDEKKAVVYFKAGAMQNDSECQYFLALCHELGRGVEVNECWAAHLYSMAASGGHDEAICSLARFHEHGLGGIPCDAQAAIELYAKAAELGNEEAENRLEELRELEEEKAKTKVLDPITDKLQISLPPGLPHTRSLSSSSSTPNLRPLGYSLTDFVYDRVCEFYQTCSGVGRQILFDPGGRARFQIGGNEDEDDYDVDGEINTVNSLSLGDPAMPHKCQPFHKSNTMPDLSTMVACNI